MQGALQRGLLGPKRFGNAFDASHRSLKSMLNNTLNTNEVKNAAATEVEFSRLSSSARETEFAQIAETPALPHRLKIKHQESGSGIALRRRSMFRFDKSVAGQVDTTRNAVISAYVVLDAPVGNLTAATEMANVLAEVMSFLATTGAGTTVLFDGTGNGAKTLLEGGL